MKKLLLMALSLLLCGVVNVSAKVLDADLAKFPASSENTTWDSSTNTFAWSGTSYNSTSTGLKGDLSSYTALCYNVEAGSADHFRFLIKYPDGTQTIVQAKAGEVELTWEQMGVNLKHINNISDIRLSGANDAVGNVKVNRIYLRNNDKDIDISTIKMEDGSVTKIEPVVENGVYTYTSTGGMNFIFKHLNFNVEGYNRLVVEFAEPAPDGWKWWFKDGQGWNDIATGSTSLVYDIEEGTTTLPQLAIFTLWGAASGPLKIKSVTLQNVVRVYEDVVLKNYAFTPITLEEALTTDKKVVLRRPDGRILNGTWGQYGDAAQMHDVSDFDEKNYQLLIEAIQIDNVENTYTIKLNEGGSYKRYIQASMWGHAFFNANYGDQKGNDGQNCAIWTIAELGDNTYSIRSLGIEQGAIRKDNGDGYLCVNGAGEVRIDSKTPVAWSFYTVEMKAAVDKVRTFSSNSTLDFSSVTDVEAYIATGIEDNNNKVILKKVEGAVPAHTGLVLKQVNDNLTITIPGCGKADVDVTGNLLVATTEATQVPAGAYVLAGKGEQFGWYLVGETIPTLAAGKCYLKAPEAAGARVLTMAFEDNDATAIEEVENKAQQKVYYNLQGVRVAHPKAGMYIVNGKKVIINK